MTTTRAVRILIVDEEEPLTHVLGLALELEGWEVRVVPTGAGAIDAIPEFEPDIVLLDMVLPDSLGTEVVSAIRAGGVTTPVVFLTGRASHDDRLAGYAAGADDYITKPFGLEEVVDHLRPLVRRLGLAPTSHAYADLVLDDSTAEVWRNDERIPLTPIEFEMLRALLENHDSPLTLGQVLRSLAVRGTRVPRELAQRMLDRMRALVNSDRSPLVHVVGTGGWMLSAA
jgi:two-component system, OmpR family, response regulator